MTYFAYGSNMLRRRLQERVASAVPLGVARLDGYSLRWHKRSKDGSGKCDAYRTDDAADCIWGVLYEMDASDKPVLDGIEGVGVGYDAIEVNGDLDGKVLRACTYVATDIDATLKPYDWYKGLVLAGAKEAGLPEEYITGVEAAGSIEDPDDDRRRAAEEILGDTQGH